jgi:hypothetical protein
MLLRTRSLPTYRARPPVFPAFSPPENAGSGVEAARLLVGPGHARTIDTIAGSRQWRPDFAVLHYPLLAGHARTPARCPISHATMSTTAGVSVDGVAFLFEAVYVANKSSLNAAHATRYLLGAFSRVCGGQRDDEHSCKGWRSSYSSTSE